MLHLVCQSAGDLDNDTLANRMLAVHGEEFHNRIIERQGHDSFMYILRQAQPGFSFVGSELMQYVHTHTATHSHTDRGTSLASAASFIAHVAGADATADDQSPTF